MTNERKEYYREYYKKKNDFAQRMSAELHVLKIQELLNIKLTDEQQLQLLDYILANFKYKNTIDIAKK